MTNVKFGVNTGQANTTWPELRELWQELDGESNYDYLWLVDHVECAARAQVWVEQDLLRVKHSGRDHARLL